MWAGSGVSLAGGEHHGGVPHCCMAEVSGSACKWAGRIQGGEQTPIMELTSADSKVHQMSKGKCLPETYFMIINDDI